MERHLFTKKIPVDRFMAIVCGRGTGYRLVVDKKDENTLILQAS